MDSNRKASGTTRQRVLCRRLVQGVLVAVLFIGMAAGAIAAPIYYQISGKMTGSLGSTMFTDAQVDYTFVADTTHIVDVSTSINTTLPPGYAYFNTDPGAVATVTVHLPGGGALTATFTQPMYWSVDAYNGGVAITAPTVAPAYPYALKTGGQPLNAASYDGPIFGSPFSCTNFDPVHGGTCTAPAALTTSQGDLRIMDIQTGCPNTYLGIAPVPCQLSSWYVAAASPSLYVTLAGDGAGNVTSSPATVNCSTTCVTVITPGASLVLTATPAAGSVFAGWTGACSGASATCTPDLTSGVSNVSAIFKPLTVASAISVGGVSACAVDSTSALQCWGNVIGAESFVPSYVGRPASPVPTVVAALATSVNSSSDGTDNHACVVTSARAAQCWGVDSSGQVGNGTVSPVNPVAAPVTATGLTSGVIAVSAGLAHTCALTATHTVQCWGDNTYGELGNGTNTASASPVAVTGLPADVIAIAAGGGADPVDPGVGAAHSCALTLSGEVWCWGDNRGGQLGNSAAVGQSMVPVSVTGLSGRATAITAGEFHTCALISDGAVQCWGQFLYWTGNPATTPGTVTFTTATALAGLSSGVAYISAGPDHDCALKITGSVLCWGDNLFGELGDGTTTSSPTTPVAVTGLPTDILAIASGGGGFLGGTIDRRGANTCALTFGGSVWCWGDDSAGQLGLGTTLLSATPVGIPGFGNNGAGPPRPNPLVITNPPGAPAQLATATAGGSPLVLSATAASGLAPTFSSFTPELCTVTGATVHFFAPGLCVVRAAQAGDATYGPAPVQTREIVVQGSTTTSTTTVLASSANPSPVGSAVMLTATVSGNAPNGSVTFFDTGIALGACGSRGTVALAGAAASCSVASLSAGHHAMSAIYSGDANNPGGTSNAVDQVVSTSLLSQSITMAPIPDTRLRRKHVAIVASASSGLPVVLTSQTPLVCSVAGVQATLLSRGTCTIAADQAGNSVYAAAPEVTRSFRVTGHRRDGDDGDRDEGDERGGRNGGDRDPEGRSQGRDE